MSSQALTIKQARFVDAMLDDKVATQKDAAIKAGYSPKTAHSIASQVIAKAKVAGALEVKRNGRSDKARGELSKFEWLQSKFGAAVDKLDPDNLDAQTLLGSLQILQKCRESELAIRERYGIDKSADPAVLATQAQSLQRLIVTTLLCALHRPAVARRILARHGVEVDEGEGVAGVGRPHE